MIAEEPFHQLFGGFESADRSRPALRAKSLTKPQEKVLTNSRGGYTMYELYSMTHDPCCTGRQSQGVRLEVHKWGESPKLLPPGTSAQLKMRGAVGEGTQGKGIPIQTKSAGNHSTPSEPHGIGCGAGGFPGTRD